MKDFSVNPPNVYGFGHKAYYEYVDECIKNIRTNLIEGATGRKSLALINAIYRSIETEKQIFLSSIASKSRLGNV